MISKGDTEKQATLRDSLIKKGTTSRSIYVSRILSVLKPDMAFLMLAVELATSFKNWGQIENARNLLDLMSQEQC
jgi:hypothetical protein